MNRTNLTRLFAMLVALMLVLCACGDGKEQVSGTITPISTEAPATEPAATEAPAAQMSLGQIEGGVYSNSYLDLQIELDSTWVYKSAEELQQIPSNVAELFKDSELADNISALEQFTDMSAESVERMASMNVLFQKLDMQTRLLYATMTNEAIIDLTLAQSDMLIEAYKSAGMDVDKMEKVTVTFRGEERVAIKTSAYIQDIPYFTLQILDFHRGQYSATITFATYMEDNTESLLELCSPIA